MLKQEFPRKTKILCTIGPAISGVENLVRMIYSGMDAARLNFSHGSHEQHLKSISEIREASKIAKRHVPIVLDLQGPKIRTGVVENGEVFLQDGAQFIITIDDIPIGDAQRVSTSYKNLLREVSPRNTILLDDGYIILEVINTNNNDIITKVIKGGLLKDKKGIIVPGVSSSAPSLSDKDISDLRFGLENGIDAVALSFVRSGRDVVELKAAMKIYGQEVPIISKIERFEAVYYIDEIIEESHAIMVARGDLGLEMPAERLPSIQKQIIQRCNYYGKPVITATQMLESMINNPRPTRAEASDVANAVLDGTDCVMLSGETSVGKYPFDAVGYMARIVQSIEEQYPYEKENYKGFASSDIFDAIGNAACVVAENINASAIVILADSTSTAKNISSFRPKVPIVALSHNEEVCRRLSLVWGVTPIYINEELSSDNSIESNEPNLLNTDFVKHGDMVVIVSGSIEAQKDMKKMILIHTIK